MDNVQKVVVSVVRFSSAFALFGVEKLQTAIASPITEHIPSAITDVESTFDTMADTLMGQMDSGKRGVLDSVAKMATEVTERSYVGFRMVDPRRVVQAANELVQKSAEVIANWPGDGSGTGSDKKEASPRLAVDVLNAS